MSLGDKKFREMSEGEYWIRVKDVKEFIKKLKCYNKNKLMDINMIVISIKDLNDEVGKDLI